MEQALLELLKQAPGLGVLVGLVVMFLTHLRKTQTTQIESDRKRDEVVGAVLSRVALSMDRNTEALGRNTEALSRTDEAALLLAKTEVTSSKETRHALNNLTHALRLRDAAKGFQKREEEEDK